MQDRWMQRKPNAEKMRKSGWGWLRFPAATGEIFIWVNYGQEDSFQVRVGKRKELSWDLGGWEGVKGKKGGRIRCLRSVEGEQRLIYNRTFLEHTKMHEGHANIDPAM